MANETPRSRPETSPVRHTAGFLEVDVSGKRTIYGEDLPSTTTILNNLLLAGFDFDHARTVLVPRIVAGIRSERAYRRECHRSVKALGHVAGRHLYHGIVGHEDAAVLLRDFVDVSANHNVPKVGLELGHIELSGTGVSVDEAWTRLDDLAEEAAAHAGVEVVDARGLEPSHRIAAFVDVDADGREVKLPRGRSNFPTLDIGRTGLQLFVRAAIGYDKADLQPFDLEELREAHAQFMERHTGQGGIIRMGDDKFAYPIAATLVALQRNGSV